MEKAAYLLMLNQQFDLIREENARAFWEKVHEMMVRHDLSESEMRNVCAEVLGDDDLRMFDHYIVREGWKPSKRGEAH